MERIADKLTHYIIKSRIIGEGDYEIYRCGILTGLEMTLLFWVLYSFP